MQRAGFDSDVNKKKGFIEVDGGLVPAFVFDALTVAIFDGFLDDELDFFVQVRGVFFLVHGLIVLR